MSGFDISKHGATGGVVRVSTPITVSTVCGAQEIPQALSELVLTLASLREAVESLDNRLQPICTPNEPEATGTAPVVRYSVPLAVQIQDATVTVHKVTEHLSRILQNLGV